MSALEEILEELEGLDEIEGLDELDEEYIENPENTVVRLEDFFNELDKENTVVRLNVTFEDYSKDKPRAIDVLRRMRNVNKKYSQQEQKEAKSIWYFNNAYRNKSKPSLYDIDRFEILLTFAQVKKGGADYIFGGAYKIAGFEDEGKHYVLERISGYDVLVNKLCIKDEHRSYGAIKRLMENLKAEVYFVKDSESSQASFEKLEA